MMLVERVSSITKELRGSLPGAGIKCLITRQCDGMQDESINRVCSFAQAMKHPQLAAPMTAGVVHIKPPFLLLTAQEPEIQPRAVANAVASAVDALAPGAHGELRVCVHPAWPCDPHALHAALQVAFWEHTRHVTEPRPVFETVTVRHQRAEAPAGWVWRGPRALPVGEMTCFGMSLIQEPANILTPAEFGKRVQAQARGVPNLRVVELHEPELAKRGMNLMLASAAGSVNRPRVVVLEYTPLPDQRPVCLVGKGVTFDSGGISLKPPKKMHLMKTDMAGAAIAAATVLAAAKQGLRHNVVAVCGMIENMPSGSAYRPGDVLKTLSGQSVEVLDTDAEGRNVLADCMWFTGTEYKPTAMLTVATLTGAICVALGSYWAGLYTASGTLATELLEASKSAENGLWRMPLGTRAMADKMRSTVADLKHIAYGEQAGSVYAATFLSRFVPPQVGRWAHIDCAGTVFDDDEEVPTGWGVPLLSDWLMARATHTKQ